MACLDCALTLNTSMFDSNSAVNCGGAIQLSPADFLNSMATSTASCAAVFQKNGIVFFNSSASFASDFVSSILHEEEFIAFTLESRTVNYIVIKRRGYPCILYCLQLLHHCAFSVPTRP